MIHIYARSVRDFVLEAAHALVEIATRWPR
jgi:hypothetical protein